MVKKGMCPVFTLAGFPAPLDAILKIFAKTDGELAELCGEMVWKTFGMGD